MSLDSHQKAGALRPPRDIQEMFDRIVQRYDVMNRVMTGGRDVVWRRRAARAAIGSGADHVLDIATGTGDLAIEFTRQGVPKVVGLDFAGRMLHVAEEKVRCGEAEVSLVRGDAMSLPFSDATFDAATVAWGLRNMPDYREAITEMSRVLVPGGRLVILEMTPLQQPLLRKAFNLYFEYGVPVIGGLISGDRDAYRYLPQSVSAFPDADILAELMQGTGLRNVRYQLLGGGTVAMHVGIRGTASRTLNSAGL